MFAERTRKGSQLACPASRPIPPATGGSSATISCTPLCVAVWVTRGEMLSTRLSTAWLSASVVATKRRMPTARAAAASSPMSAAPSPRPCSGSATMIANSALVASGSARMQRATATICSGSSASTATSATWRTPSTSVK